VPNEFTDAKLEEMVGHYKRSKWMAEREVLQAAKEGLPVIVAMPTTPVGLGIGSRRRRERLFWIF